jgi:putative redox protein
MTHPDNMHVRLERIGTAAFEARSDSGAAALVIDGAPAIGGEGRGMRPMEVLLSALASCAAMDVVAILSKQKEPLETLSIDIMGTRAQATPAPFTTIKLLFTANAGLDDHKYQRAVKLSVEKYCSVGATLDPAVVVEWEARLAAPSGPPS